MAYSGYQLLSSYVSSGVFEAACYYSQLASQVMSRIFHRPVSPADPVALPSIRRTSGDCRHGLSGKHPHPIHPAGRFLRGNFPALHDG